MLFVKKLGNISYVFMKLGCVDKGEQLLKNIKEICLQEKEADWEIIEPIFISQTWWNYIHNPNFYYRLYTRDKIFPRIFESYLVLIISDVENTKLSKIMGYVEINGYNRLYDQTYNYMKNINGMICMLSSSIEIKKPYRGYHYGESLIKFTFRILKDIGYTHVFLTNIINLEKTYKFYAKLSQLYSARFFNIDLEELYVDYNTINFDFLADNSKIIHNMVYHLLSPHS